ncbi:uncharacterized protein LOC143822960 isoform X3 [Paroedura picta]|uniref:uncharacterized protein LOC143822960 isoform X3 n=1 Tax=Paroedura picta TaxID=143630 RepID=UPI0040577BD1
MKAMRERSISAGYWLVCCSWLLAIGPLRGIEGGCGNREAHQCCPGRNNDCLDFSRRRTPCYCDNYCEKTGDCCDDYHAVCQVSAAVDCVVGPWGPWSECSALCGTGSKDRMRQVIVPPRNGGAPCPDLKQRRGCLGESPLCETAKEVAKILPNSFKRDFKDPWRRPHMLMREKMPREPDGERGRHPTKNKDVTFPNDFHGLSGSSICTVPWQQRPWSHQGEAIRAVALSR